MSRGIVNPWKKAPVVAPGEARPRSEIRYEHEVPIGSPAPDTVGFRGQAYTIFVETLPRKGIEPDVLARAHLGGLLVDLLASAPVAAQALEAQALHRTRPLGPAIVLEFGDLTLYAKASSTDPELATKMAVDRLALALNEVRAVVSTAKKAFEAYHVSIARKA